ncbi:uncharacterized protein TNCV_595761 [Trichonephila clavipes]|nr:uncharacterized protein TNCV_595761 [Trichonephila clavipes]
MPPHKQSYNPSLPDSKKRVLSQTNIKAGRPKTVASKVRNKLKVSDYVRVPAVAEWYRHRIMACLITSWSPVPLKTRSVEQRCTLNLSRAETSSRWCGVVFRRGGSSSGVVHVP